MPRVAPSFYFVMPWSMNPGDPVWDTTVLSRSLNRSEVEEATRLCALTNASVTINISPWSLWWGAVGESATQRAECPRNLSQGFLLCDPTVQGAAEALVWLRAKATNPRSLGSCATVVGFQEVNEAHF